MALDSSISAKVNRCAITMTATRSNVREKSISKIEIHHRLNQMSFDNLRLILLLAFEPAKFFKFNVSRKVHEKLSANQSVGLPIFRCAIRIQSHFLSSSIANFTIHSRSWDADRKKSRSPASNRSRAARASGCDARRGQNEREKQLNWRCEFATPIHTRMHRIVRNRPSRSRCHRSNNATANVPRERVRHRGGKAHRAASECVSIAHAAVLVFE